MTAPSRAATMVSATIDVAVTPARAFEVFTGRINDWWHPGHHLLDGDLKEVRIEPYVGGRIQEESVTGETCIWGRVLTWEPPQRYAFSWLINKDWAVPAPDAVGSRVTVTFTATETGTHVELVHDRLDIHGPGWESIRDSVGASGGWTGLIRRFADLVEQPG
jgi:uncharacterized protein YndB with AHSA1/START domain